MTRAMPMPVPLPADVKLMNLATLVLGASLVALALTAVVSWLMRQSLFNLGTITVLGDMAHNNVITLRANVAPRLEGNFFTVDLNRTRSVFESAPWVRQAVEIGRAHV